MNARCTAAMHTRGTYDGDIGLRCHYAGVLCVLMVVELERIMNPGAFSLQTIRWMEKRGGGVVRGTVAEVR